MTPDWWWIISAGSPVSIPPVIWVRIRPMRLRTGQERGARFVCSIAAMLPDGRVLHTEAVMEGLIAGEPAGNGGFGYDPILYLPEFGRTSAEITMEQKNEISHRGKALRAMKKALEDVLK